MNWETVAVRRHTWPKVFRTLKLDKRPLHHIQKSGAVVTFKTTTKGLKLIQREHPGAVVEHHTERLGT